MDWRQVVLSMDHASRGRGPHARWRRVRPATVLCAHAWRDRLEGDLGPKAMLRHEAQGVAAAVEKAVGDTRTVLVRVDEHRANVEAELAAKTLELRAKIESTWK